MDIRLQEEQARLCYLAHGSGELSRPLAQALKLPSHCSKLLQDIGCVHGLAPEVVGDAVECVGCLVLLVTLLVEPAVEPVGTGEVEHHVAACCDVLRRQLQEQPHECRCCDVQCAREFLRALDVRLAYTYVQAPVESFHGSP